MDNKYQNDIDKNNDEKENLDRQNEKLNEAQVEEDTKEDEEG